MKYFLDCGAYNGWSVRHFQRTFIDWPEYRIHSFEPDPAHKDCFSEFANVTLHEAAVWIDNGKRPFFVGQGKGSSLLADKITGQLNPKPIMVLCLDFSRWLMAHCRRDDYVMLKMDIEGSEYAVLHKMIDDGSISYVDRLYVEWHREKIGVSAAGHQFLVERLIEGGLEIGDWSRP